MEHTFGATTHKLGKGQGMSSKQCICILLVHTIIFFFHSGIGTFRFYKRELSLQLHGMLLF